MTVHDHHPIEVKRLGDEALKIAWNDGRVDTLPAAVLRAHCPSATSKAKRGDESHEKPLTGRRALKVVSHSVDEQLRIEQVWAVGNYAIGMRWSDGHDSGIYSYDYLRSLGTLQSAN